VTPTGALSCMRASIDEAGAIEIAGRAGTSPPPRAGRRLHYPYYRFLFRSTASTLLGESTSHVCCLVDARTGLAATSDPFDTVTLHPPGEDVLGPTLGEAEANALARRFVRHVIHARRRSLATPRIEPLDRGLVYKPFWVVAGGTASLLVDGVTGATLPLRGAAGPTLQTTRRS
jgi:hypothetical protein